MNGNWLSKDTFQRADTETKFNLIHDGILAIHTKFQEGNQRITTLENKDLYNKGCSFIGGVIGGFLAFIGQKIFWK
jgi:hypothetical protein